MEFDADQKPRKMQRSFTSYLLGRDLKQLREHKGAPWAAAELEPYVEEIAEMLKEGIPAIVILRTVCNRLGVSKEVGERAIRICLHDSGVEFKLDSNSGRAKAEAQAQDAGARKGFQADGGPQTQPVSAPAASAPAIDKPAPVADKPAPVADKPAPAAASAPVKKPAPLSAESWQQVLPHKHQPQPRQLRPGEVPLIGSPDGETIEIDEYLARQLRRFESGIAIDEDGKRNLLQTVFADGTRSVPYPRYGVEAIIRGMMGDIRRIAERVWASRPEGPPPGERVSKPVE